MFNVALWLTLKEYLNANHQQRNTSMSMKKTNDEESGEAARLNPLQSFGSISSSAVSVAGSLESNVARWHEHSVVMIRQLAVSLAFGVLGWYVPRYLIYHEQGIEKKQAPYQTTSAGDVILDFTLNQPLVDPPTISCTYDYTGRYYGLVNRLVQYHPCTYRYYST
jgi:hypothetical protein